MTLSLEERRVRDEARKTLRKLGQRERKEKQAQRPKSPKADRGRIRDPGFLAYLRRQPCCACRTAPPCDPAHIRTHKPGEPPTGLQRKPHDRRATALCRACHDRQHSMREADFWAQLGLDPFEVAERLFAAYEAQP